MYSCIELSSRPSISLSLYLSISLSVSLALSIHWVWWDIPSKIQAIRMKLWCETCVKHGTSKPSKRSSRARYRNLDNIWIYLTAHLHLFAVPVLLLYVFFRFLTCLTVSEIFCPQKVEAHEVLEHKVLITPSIPFHLSQGLELLTSLRHVHNVPNSFPHDTQVSSCKCCATAGFTVWRNLWRS